MKERWLPVVGYEENYSVSSTGKVRSNPRKGTRGGLLKLMPEPRMGYLRTHLYKDNHKVTICVHLVVAAAFHGPCPSGQETRHLDGNSQNNRESNLEYGTRTQNARERVIHGHHDQAAKTHCPKGHPYSPENTGTTLKADGSFSCRYCKTCKKDKIQAYRDKLKRAA